MKIENNHIDDTYVKMQKNNTGDDKDSASTPKNEVTSGVVFAGDLNLNTDTINDKRQQAQKKALKTLMDQFKNEMQSDKNVSDLKDKQNELSKDLDASASEIRNLEQNKQDLKDAYSITDDSPEQKELEQTENVNMGLYLKSIQNPDKMSDAEKEKLQNVINSLSDYQKETFHIDAMENIWHKRVNEATNSIMSINKSLNGIKLGKLKEHPMVDAQKQAAGIIKDASNEIIDTLVQQAKDKVDTTIEQNKEKIEKGQKEQDKKEKEAEKANKDNNADKAKSTNQTAPTNTADYSDTTIDQADQQQIIDNMRRIANQQNMLDDDIKGIVVDEHI